MGDGVGQWWLWFLAWVIVVVVVFFFGCDRCLKGLWIVVGSGVWVVGRGWVRCLGRGWVVAEVSCWSWIGEASHGLSLISHRGSASWVWISGLGSVDGGFETVDLLIGG